MTCFGLKNWTSSEHNSRFLRTQTTAAFDEAWEAFGALLDAVGFRGRQTPIFYDLDADQDLAALACAEIADAMPAWREEKARKRAAERAYWDRVRAEQVERDRLRALREAEKAKAWAERPARVRAELKALVEGRLWLLQPADQARAIQLAAAGERMSIDAAEGIVRKATRTLARAAERTAKPERPEAVERCADPSLREAVREACRWMSTLDDDRASDANGEGWGKTTTLSGHYLAEQSSLTPEQAAYGLRILHTHRGQLPPAMRGRLGL